MLLTPSSASSQDLINRAFVWKVPFHFFIALDSGPYPLGLKIWKSCFLAMFLLGIFSGVLICIVFLRLCQYHYFWIIDSRWLTNHSVVWEGPLVFLLKAWSRLLEGMGFHTTGSPESVCETFMDMRNPLRDEPVHKKIIAKVLEDTNQETPSQRDSCAFLFFGNIGAPLMATLNISWWNVGLLIWLWTTLNAPNTLDDSQISTLCQGHRMNVDPLPSTTIKFTPSLSSSSGEIIATNNQK
jgi:hypothetical protein